MNHLKLFASRFCTHVLWVSIFSVAVVLFGLLAGCTKEQPKPQAPPPEVAMIKIEPRDVPVTFEYVAQTQSSQQVEIRARVSGFLDKRTYTEGAIVKEGQVLFLMDKKPFEAQLDAMQGALAQQQARLQTAQANLARVKPLAAQNALSQKDLDDALGQEQAAAAAVETAKAEVVQAQLNLSYCTIASPVTGITGAAMQQDGAYVNPLNSQLTVAVLSPFGLISACPKTSLTGTAPRLPAVSFVPPRRRLHHQLYLPVYRRITSRAVLAPRPGHSHPCQRQ
jgi:membrane fusion protein (multidrug efflux system)